MTEALTARQRETLNVLGNMQKRNGIIPTQRELGALLGVTNNAVRARLSALARKGFILLLSRKARGIVLLKKAS